MYVLSWIDFIENVDILTIQSIISTSCQFPQYWCEYPLNCVRFPFLKLPAKVVKWMPSKRKCLKAFWHLPWLLCSCSNRGCVYRLRGQLTLQLGWLLINSCDCWWLLFNWKDTKVNGAFFQSCYSGSLQKWFSSVFQWRCIFNEGIVLSYFVARR